MFSFVISNGGLPTPHVLTIFGYLYPVIFNYSINPLWLEFSFTLEYFFRYDFWVANISNVGKNI